MNNIKTTLVIVLSIALTAFVLLAIWSGVQPSNAGYNTKTAGVVTAEPSSGQSMDMTEVDDESATMNDEASVEEAVVTESTDNQTEATDTVETVVAEAESVTQQAMQEAATTVNDVKQAVTEEVAVVTEAATEHVEAVTDAGKEDEVEGALYNVVDGNKLDANSYEGFKLYRNWCARCHGTYGQGMVGPNLADSLKIISEKQFFDTVENGKTGTIGSMPSWKANDQVMQGRDQLYAYLKARSDGAIGEVKPKKQ